MNLIIDQGNTTTKVAFFKDKSLVETFIFNDFNEGDLRNLLFCYSVKQAIFCTVRSYDCDWLDFLGKEVKLFLCIKDKIALPINIMYKTPETLGFDRIAAAVGAFMHSPQNNLLIIDAGTALTCEFVDRKGNYRGGNISLGLYMRFKALHHFTVRLPHEVPVQKINLIGTTTSEAIQAGVMNGMKYEIDGYIDAFKAEYPDLLVFLTGGDAKYFETQLKNEIFADKNLVLKGLNSILEYNVENK